MRLHDDNSSANPANYDITNDLGTLDVYYEIAFELNGADGSFDTIKIYDDTAVLPPEAPSMNGAGFMGWAVSGANDGVLYKPGEPMPLDDNAVLYPVWQYQSAVPDTGYSTGASVSLMIIMISALSMAGIALLRKKLN